MKKVSETKVATFKNRVPYLEEIYTLAVELESQNKEKEQQIKLLQNKLNELEFEIKENKNLGVKNEPKDNKVEEIPYDKLGRMVADLFKKYRNLENKNIKLEQEVSKNKAVVKKYNDLVKRVK